MSDEDYDDESSGDDAVEPITKRKRRPPPRLTDSWTESDTAKLITEVEMYPCLWDSRLEEYKIHSHRFEAWQKVACAFDGRIPHEQCRTKWQILRCQYRGSVASVEKGGKRPHWKYHWNMSFISAAAQNHKRKEKQRRMQQRLRRKQQAQQNVVSASDMDFSFVAMDDQSNDSKPLILPPNRTPTPVDQLYSSETVAQMPRPIPTEEAETMAKIVTIRPESRTRNVLVPSATHTTDDFQTFANFVASELRKIKDPEYAQATQRQLQKVLLQCVESEPNSLPNRFDFSHIQL